MHFNAIFLVSLFYGGVISSLSVMAKPVPEIAERAGPPRLARRGGHFCFKTLETLILPKETVTSISKEWADYPAFQHTPIFIFDHNHGVFVARHLELLEKRVEDKECMYRLKAVDGTQVAVATLHAINSHEEVAKAVSSVQQGGGYYGHFPSTIGFTKVGKIQTWIISRFYGTIFDTVLYKSLPAPAGLHWYFPALDPTQEKLTWIKEFAKAYGKTVATYYANARKEPKVETINVRLVKFAAMYPKVPYVQIQQDEWKEAGYDAVQDVRLERQATQAIEKFFRIPPE